MKVLATAVCTEAPPLARPRLIDYLELTKPRLTGMVLITVAAGALLAAAGSPHWVVVLHAVLGTSLVAAGASALNQFLERDSDCLMRRTENRPLPSGRLQPIEVLLFGSVAGVGGIIYLTLALQRPLAACVAAITLVTYVFAYTPLKRRTSLNTLVGAIPGALPPVIGWTAVRGTIDSEILAVFLILFLWQVPHFLAIAWMYRDEYARAGLQMLPVLDPEGSMTARQMMGYCIALLGASLTPLLGGHAGFLYLSGALILGLVFLGAAVAFARKHSYARARRVLRVSLLYLPILLSLLLLDGVSR